MSRVLIYHLDLYCVAVVLQWKRLEVEGQLLTHPGSRGSQRGWHGVVAVLAGLGVRARIWYSSVDFYIAGSEVVVRMRDLA